MAVKINHFLFFIVFFASCNQSNQKSDTVASLADNIIEANGFIMPYDSIKEPKVTLAGLPKKINVSESKTRYINPYFGEAGGISIMQNYNMDNGLPIDVISFGHKSSFCDKAGNIWFGTFGGGASKYDGKSFINYTTSHGLPSNFVRCITEDKMGNIWLGTDGGASKYDGRSFTNYTTKQGLAHNSVRSIIEDYLGNIWFGTAGGISKYDGNRVEAIERKDPLALRVQSDLKRVNRKLVKSITTYNTSHGLASNNVRCLHEDKLGNIWCGTGNTGLSKYDGNRVIAVKMGNKIVTRTQWDLKKISGKFVGSFTNYSLEQGLPDTIVLSIAEDKTGNLWLGTNSKGVVKFDRNKAYTLEAINQTAQKTPDELKKLNGKLAKSFTTFSNAQQLSKYGILCITEDKRGNLWFGTDGFGVMRYDGKAFTYFSTAEGLVNNFVLSITEDKAGNLWFGTMGSGVSMYVGKSFTNYTTSQGLENNLIYKIMEDRIGNLWFSTYRGGLSKYNGNRIDAIEKENTIKQADQQSDIKTTGKNVKSFINYMIEKELADKVIRDMLEDKEGNIWFATVGEGIIKYDGNRIEAIEQGDKAVVSKQDDLKKINGKFIKSFVKYSISQGLPNNNIMCAAEDKVGNLWFGTRGSGIVKYDGNRVEAIERGDKTAAYVQQGLKKINGKYVKSFTNYTTSQGLADDFILSIMEDKMGNIWIGTESGIAKYDGNRVEKIENGDAVAAKTQQDIKKINGKLVKSFTIFNTSDGLINTVINSIAEDKMGNIWFATEGGISIYDGNRVDAITSGDSIAALNQHDIKKINGKLIKSFTNYTTKQGLPDNNVTQILIDSLQNVTIGTKFGIATISPLTPKLTLKTAESLSSALSNNTSIVNKTKVPFFEVYNSSTGYPLKAVRTVYKDSKGIVWIGTCSDKTGLERFDYKALNKDTTAPNVVIKNIKINEENICWYSLGVHKYDTTLLMQQEAMSLGKVLTQQNRDSMQKKFSNIQFDSIKRFYSLPEKLVLPYKCNTISFEFGAIELARPGMIHYQYLLEGYDEDWHRENDKTNVLFGNMHEGKYTFKIKAQSPEGVWSEPVLYKFEVLPPLYRTWWAYSSYLIIGSGFLYGLLILRTASLSRDKEILERTVKKRTAEVIFQKVKVEKSAKIKENFLSNMSHEIRTPLNAITGYTSLSLQEDLPEKIKKNLQAIKLSSDHLRRLVDDILDFSKIESGKLNLRKTDFDLAQVIDEVIQLLYFKALEKGNILNSFVSDNVSRFLYGDKERLVQVLINLVDNAIKFTNQGTITINVWQFKGENEKVTVLFEVSDTGIGIPEHKLNTIFESFTQVENNISRKYSGAGLGLTISKNIIELQGGEIKVASVENKGSLFSFMLPYSKGIRPISVREGQLQIIKNKPDGLRLIVAEDDPINQDLIEQILESWGIPIDFAETGAKLIELLQTNTYHLILMDIHMPGINGFDAAKIIRTTFNTDVRNIPIIALTADVLPSTQEKIIQSGINDYVYKPIDYKILHSKIDYLLGLKIQPLKDIAIQKKWDFKPNYLNLNYLITNYGDNNSYMLKMLNKSCRKLNEYTDTIVIAYKYNDLEKILYFAHRLKTIAGVLGISSIQEKLATLCQLISSQQSVELIIAELNALESDTKMASAEINELVKYIFKNQTL